MKILATFLLLTLTGCSTMIEHVVPQILPTAKYCDEVYYQRSGREVSFAAKCEAPFGGL